MQHLTLTKHWPNRPAKYTRTRAHTQSTQSMHAEHGNLRVVVVVDGGVVCRKLDEYGTGTRVDEAGRAEIL